MEPVKSLTISRIRVVRRGSQSSLIGRIQSEESTNNN
nr:MAG TPA: hypothetical protein [Caudoviricetes sp.]